MPKAEGVPEVIEAVVITALCSLAYTVVTWFGKKFLDVDNSDKINVYVNNNPLPMTEYEGEPTGDCDCPFCTEEREAREKDDKAVE